MVLQPKISCIVPTLNRHDVLKNCLQLFQNQTYVNKEIIIVDDTNKIYEPFAKNKITNEKNKWLKIYKPYDDVYYIYMPRKKNQGYYSIGMKRNIAIEQANGSIIAFWDDDDYHGPTRLENQYNELKKTGADIYAYNTVQYYKEGKIFKTTRNLHYKLWQEGYVSAYMFKKKIYNKVKFRDVSLAEDYLFIYDAKQMGYIVKSGPMKNKTDFIYVKHPGSTWKIQFNKNQLIYL
jgi:glycosyltransferase involved in cell wall biosynthesis